MCILATKDEAPVFFEGGGVEKWGRGRLRPEATRRSKMFSLPTSPRPDLVGSSGDLQKHGGEKEKSKPLLVAKSTRRTKGNQLRATPWIP